MKKNGFLSTSLLYSFFLVFIAIIAVLLNNYIASKTILDRYNENVSDNLNNNSFTVRIISKGGFAYLNDGKHDTQFNNLVSDGNFQTINTSETMWEKDGSLSTSLGTYNSKQTLSINYSSSNTIANNIYTPIQLIKGNVYYIRYNAQSANGKVFVDLSSEDGTSNFVSYEENESTLKTKSYRYVHEGENTMALLKIGRRSTTFTGTARFSDVMILDLTNTFLDNMPKQEWLDENISYFDEIANILIEENITKNNYLRVYFRNGNTTSTDEPTLSCVSNGNWTPNANNLKLDKSVGVANLEIRNITDSITCTLEW